MYKFGNFSTEYINKQHTYLYISLLPNGRWSKVVLITDGQQFVDVYCVHCTSVRVQ